MRNTYFDGGVLTAMAHLASKKDIRYYLNGVLMEVNNDYIRCVATDGHVIGVFQQKNMGGDQGEPFSVIVPHDVIDKLDKKKLQHTLIKNGDDYVIDNIGFKGIDGKFPDYERVFKMDKVSGQVAQFNPDFIARFVKVGKAFGMKRPMPVISYNGEKSALVSIGKDNFVGLMMPYRSEAPMDFVPTWLVKQENTLTEAK